MVNYLSNHHEFISSQHATVTGLIAEGKGHLKYSVDHVEDLFEILAEKNAAVAMKKSGESLKKGNGALKANVEFGDKATKETVKPEEIKKNFAESAKFNAEISDMFPKEYAEIKDLRQTLKIHHFTLSNTIKDVELLATSTRSNLGRSVRKLELRKKYIDDAGKELKPSTDAKIWKYEIKS
jgi:hypothetical protein